MTTRGRRRFLKLALASTGIAVTGAVGAWFARDRLRGYLYRLPTEVAPGALHADTMGTLLAVTVSLLGDRIERGHYRDYFSWYAGQVAGYKGAYERIAAMLDHATLATEQRVFVQCEAGMQRKLVESLRAARDNRWLTVVTGIRDRDRLLLERYLVEPVLALYGRTDAWIAIGYDAWPGQARGFDRYRRPPAAARARAAG